MGQNCHLNNILILHTFKSFNPPISSQETFGISTVTPLVMLGPTIDLALFQSSLSKLQTSASTFAFEHLFNAHIVASRHKASKSAPT